MKEIKWVNDKYGSSSRASVMRGALILVCHYSMLRKGDELPTHPYSIYVGKRLVGHAADAQTGHKFAEHKFKELIEEQVS